MNHRYFRRRFSFAWVWVLAAGLLGVSAPCSAQTSPDEAEIRGMLGGIEDTPSANEWRRLSGALPALIALRDNTSEPPFIRLRALGAMRHFPSPELRTYLLGVTQDRRESELSVRAALASLLAAFGESALVDALPFLNDRRPTIRDGLAQALGRVGTARALQALRQRLPIEREPSVLHTLRTLLATAESIAAESRAAEAGTTVR